MPSHGQRGIFPSTYVQICDPPSAPAPKLPPRPPMMAQSTSTPQFQFQQGPVPSPTTAPTITVTAPTAVRKNRERNEKRVLLI